MLRQLREPEGFSAQVRYLSGHCTETSQDELELRDGRTLDRYSAPRLGVDGTYYGRIWYFRDVTQRKRSEETLWESGRRCRAIFEGASVGMALTSLDGYFMEVNTALATTLGYRPEELAGWGCRSGRSFPSRLRPPKNHARVSRTRLK